MYVLIFHPRMNNLNPFSSFSDGRKGGFPDVGREPFRLSEGRLSGCRKGAFPGVGKEALRMLSLATCVQNKLI